VDLSKHQSSKKLGWGDFSTREARKRDRSGAHFLIKKIAGTNSPVPIIAAFAGIDRYLPNT
jgi:hypothetical protein